MTTAAKTRLIIYIISLPLSNIIKYQKNGIHDLLGILTDLTTMESKYFNKTILKLEFF